MRVFLVLILLFYIKIGECAKIEDYLFCKQATAPAVVQNEFGAISLDKDIYRHTDNSFNSLRIFDENYNEIPYVIRIQRVNEKATRTYTVPMNTLSLEELPNNRISIILQNKNKGLVPSEMAIRTANRNFEKTVSVYGSNDRIQWQPLAENQPIFDYSRFIDLRNTDVSFKKLPFTYYKVTLDNVSEELRSSFSQIFVKYSEHHIQEQYEAFRRYKETLQIKDIQFSGTEDKFVYGSEKIVSHPLKLIKTTINKDEKTSNIYLASDRQPITRLLFRVESKNFKRLTVVEGTDETGSDPKWNNIASAEIFNISAGQFQKEKLEIDLPHTRYLRYHVRIFNQDNIPIKVSSVEAKGLVHEIVFSHNNRRTLKVCYGGENLQVPQYDVSSILAELPPVEGSRWNIDKQEDNKAVGMKKKQIVSPKTLLMGALTVMVVVLIYLVVFGVKKVDEKTKTQEE